MDFWRKKLRTRAGEFDNRRMWLMAACLSACLLRRGALRVTVCLTQLQQFGGKSAALSVP
jgi:hypothetical protein